GEGVAVGGGRGGGEGGEGGGVGGGGDTTGRAGERTGQLRGRSGFPAIGRAGRLPVPRGRGSYVDADRRRLRSAARSGVVARRVAADSLAAPGRAIASLGPAGSPAARPSYATR